MSWATPPRYSEDGRHWWDGGRWLPVSHPPRVKRPSPLLVVPLCVVVIAVCVAVMLGLAVVSAGAQGTAGTGAPPTSQPSGSGSATLSDVRACAWDDFDTGAGHCRRNRAGTSFQAAQIACSAAVATTGGEPAVRFSLMYDGKEVAETNAQLQSNDSKGYSAYAGFGLGGDVKLPGGQWGCQFQVSQQRKSASFRLDGPTGQLLYSSACSGDDVASANGLILCTRDETQISSPSSVACTAVVANAQGKQVRLDVSYQASGGGQPASRSFNGTADSALFGASGQVRPQDLGISGSTMSAGSYTCTWSVDGAQVGQKKFTVQ